MVKQIMVVLDDDKHAKIVNHKKSLGMTWIQYLMRDIKE
jgi:hypothetical protein